MESKIKYILYLTLLILLSSCHNKPEPNFRLLIIDKNDEMEFLGKKNISRSQFSHSLDSLVKLNEGIYLMLDLDKESSYTEFYHIRKILQKHRDKVLVSLKKPIDQINYFTISAEPEVKEINRFSAIQTIEINRAISGEFILNDDLAVTKEKLSEALFTEANKLLSQQKASHSQDKVIMFWINLFNRTTHKEYEFLGQKLNETIRKLNSENEGVITRIIELRKDDN